MASPKESQNTSHPESSETVGTLSIWSLGLMIVTICLITTIDFAMISSPLDSQEILHARINERHYPTRHQQNQASRYWTERIPESGICTPEMMGKEARLSPKPSLQEPTTGVTRSPTETAGTWSKEPEAPKIEGGILEEMDQTTTSNQIIKPRDGKLTE